MALEHVFSPLVINGLEIKNRVLRTAHGTNLGAELSDDLIAYHAARAAGGVGLSILEILSVHPTSPAPLNMFDPTLDAGYGKLMDAVRPHGMAVFQQIWHAGHNGTPIDGSPPWSPSDIPNPLGGAVPIPMTKDMIDEIIAAYAATAARCDTAGSFSFPRVPDGIWYATTSVKWDGPAQQVEGGSMMQRGEVRGGRLVKLTLP